MSFALPSWRTLPRESRDTLFLLGVIAWTVMPHLPNIPLWCGLLTAAVLLWRAQLALNNAPLPGRWLLLAVLALAAGLTLWSFKTLLGKEPGVTLAVVLMSLKTLELRARRDAFVVFFLGFFLVLTHFLFSQSLLVAAAMLASVWGLLTALVLAHMPVGQPSLRQASSLALRTALLGAPIMVLLFVLFPRIGPLWGVPQDGVGKTGLSNSMRMGSVAEIAQDDTIAMRVRFLDAAPRSESLYFRGPVLTRFDGKTWAPSYSAYASPRTELRTQGPALRYEVTLEALRLPLLSLLEATTEASPPPELQAFRREDLVWSVNRPVFERVRFNATAYTAFSHGPVKRDNSLRENVQLPAGYNPRTLAWAEQLGRDPRFANADAPTLARAVMQHIRTGGFTYTLAPGEYGEADPRATLDEFWLDRKEGFCEHFAAAFVFIMRALDVPARVVTGYQGADPVPVDGYYVVRQSYAHAWAEYWQEGVGWVRADPTAAVAPDRIVRSRNLAPAPGVVAGAINSLNPQFLAQMRDTWESLNNRWNQWVLNYSRGQQLDLMKQLGFQSPSWSDLALLLIGILSGLALLGAAWAWWDRHRQDPWQRQAQELRRALRPLGLEALAHEPPRLLAGQISQRFGVRGQALAGLLQSLDQQRYGRAALQRPSAEWMRALRHEAKGLRREPRGRPR
ncbi:transglutaminase family protein [Sphaerotilaceae bacterium SBD11-9]